MGKVDWLDKIVMSGPSTVMTFILIWAMVYPMMIVVDFSGLNHVRDQPRELFHHKW